MTDLRRFTGIFLLHLGPFLDLWTTYLCLKNGFEEANPVFLFLFQFGWPMVYFFKFIFSYVAFGVCWIALKRVDDFGKKRHTVLEKYCFLLSGVFILLANLPPIINNSLLLLGS